MSGVSAASRSPVGPWRLGWLIVGFLIAFGMATSLGFAMLPAAILGGSALAYFDRDLESTRPLAFGAIGFALGAAVIAVLVFSN